MVVDDMKYMYLLSSAKNTNNNVSEMHVERRRYIRVEFVETVESSRQSRGERQRAEPTAPSAVLRSRTAFSTHLVRLHGLQGRWSARCARCRCGGVESALERRVATLLRATVRVETLEDLRFCLLRIWNRSLELHCE